MRGSRTGRTTRAVALILVASATLTGSLDVARAQPAAQPTAQPAAQPAAPPVATSRTVASSVGFGGPGTITINSAGLVKRKLGCMKDLSPATMQKELGERFGPALGFDNPHVIKLGNGRYLWITHDTYLDHTFTATNLVQVRPQFQNVAFIQDGRCFTMYHRGTPQAEQNFEPGVGGDPPESFFWPLGGVRDGGLIKVFWAKMVASRDGWEAGDGIIRHPVSTWIAQYRTTDLKRVSFVEAPTSRVRERPELSDFIIQYGFAVESNATHTYLFGNPNMLNLSRNGGRANGPHPATRNYLARVPRGKIEQAPEFRTATGWSRDPNDAVVISRRFFTENTMQPRRYGDNQWVAITKEDGFYGRRLYIDIATRPWGPWRNIRRIDYVPRFGHEEQTSYAPILMPWRTADGDLTAVVALNNWDFRRAQYHPEFYRPGAHRVGWPFGT